MSTTCDIEFENNRLKIVYTGQVLRGTVRLNLMDTINVRSVYIRVNGKAFAQWRVGQSYTTAQEKCLDEKMQLAGDTIGDIKLDPGMHNYAFEFMIPSNIPSSMEGTYGHIRYTIRVVLDVPRWRNTTFKDPFTVINAINLNNDQSLRQPLIIEETKNASLLCLICLGSNLIKIIARTQAGGFVPGQTINLEINVNNLSNVEISKFTVELIKLITYSKQQNCFGCTSTLKQLEQFPLFKETSEGCGANQDKIIRIAAQIPTTIPSDSSICKIIKITYSIRIKASMPLFYRNPTIDLPVTIGLYPFQNDFFPQTNYF